MCRIGHERITPLFWLNFRSIVKNPTPKHAVCATTFPPIIFSKHGHLYRLGGYFISNLQTAHGCNNSLTFEFMQKSRIRYHKIL